MTGPDPRDSADEHRHPSFGVTTTLEVEAHGIVADAVGLHLPALVFDAVASRLASGDPSLWRRVPDGAAEGGLAWVEPFTDARTAIEEAGRLRERLMADGIRRVVLCAEAGLVVAVRAVGGETTADGMTTTASLEGAVEAVSVAPAATVVVAVGEAEVAARAALEHLGMDPARHLVLVVPDNRSSNADAESRPARAVFSSPRPDLAGFAVLSAAVLVPAVLAGADVAAVLDDAEAVIDLLGEDAEGNPALVLAAAVAGTSPLLHRVRVRDLGTGSPDLAPWVAALLDAATGGASHGLRCEVDGPDTLLHEPAGVPDPAQDGVLVVRLAGSGAPIDGDDLDPVGDRPVPADPGGGAVAAGPRAVVPGPEVTVAGPLGAQLVLWQFAAAVAARLLDVDPFAPTTAMSSRPGTGGGPHPTESKVIR